MSVTLSGKTVLKESGRPLVLVCASRSRATSSGLSLNLVISRVVDLPAVLDQPRWGVTTQRLDPRTDGLSLLSASHTDS